MSNPRSNAADAPTTPIILAQSGVLVTCPADTNEDILAAIPIPAGIMGLNGALRLTALWTFTNNANAKSLRARLGGLSGTDFLGVNVAAAGVSLRLQIEIRNRGAQNSQIAFAANQGGFAVTTGANIPGAIDMSVSQSLVITAQKTVGGDTITLESYLLEVLPS